MLDFNLQARDLKDEVRTVQNKLIETERKQSGHTDFLLTEMKRQREELDILRAEKQEALLENKLQMAASKPQMVNELIGTS